jgi:hypothetical protein
MTDHVLFVDLENVQTMDLSRISTNVRVMVFYGITQKKLPEELVVQAQPFGSRLKWIKISGQGPNALDFHIAYYLGLELAQRPQACCVILSRDTGFDPLVRHVKAQGFECTRVGSLKDAPLIMEAPAEAAEYSRLMTLLRKERARPIKRKGLVGKVRSWFPRLSEEERTALVNRLFQESTVTESEGELTYNL